MNKVLLIGRMTADINLKETSGGKTLGFFKLAVPKDNSKEADFIDCIAWDKTAENMQTYTHKGKQIAIQGHLQSNSYEKDGQKHYQTQVVCEKVEFLGKREDDTPIGFEKYEEDIPY